MTRHVTTLVGLLALAACSQSAPRSERQPDGRGSYTVTGVVLGQSTPGTITLAHDAIAGYMPAMAMDFHAGQLPALGNGDRIRATLVVDGGESRLTDVVVTRRGGTLSPASATPSAGPTIGGELPDVELRNQDNDVFRIRDFRGRVLFVNFIYTRCPMPEYCPRLLGQFEGLRRHLRARRDLWAKVHLLSVTFDPVHDAPDVLRAYGEARLDRRKPFEQWDLATGRPDDIGRLASFAGLIYKPAAGQIQHSMETLIIGSDGRLVKQFAHGSWSLEDAVDIVTREARRAETF